MLAPIYQIGRNASPAVAIAADDPPIRRPMSAEIARTAKPIAMTMMRVAYFSCQNWRPERCDAQHIACMMKQL